jgi:hypothetical protein
LAPPPDADLADRTRVGAVRVVVPVPDRPDYVAQATEAIPYATGAAIVTVGYRGVFTRLVTLAPPERRTAFASARALVGPGYRQPAALLPDSREIPEPVDGKSPKRSACRWAKW